MRVALAIPLAALLSSCAPPPPPAAPYAAATVPDQAWEGRLRCAVMEGMSRELNQRVVVEVRGGVARMEREVLMPDTPIGSGFHERVEGAVGPRGGVTLAGQGYSRSANYRAEYRGLLPQAGGPAELNGAQYWTFARRRPEERSCSLTLRRIG